MKRLSCTDAYVFRKDVHDSEDGRTVTREEIKAIRGRCYTGDPESERRLELAGRCLALIRDIADRGAASGNPDLTGYTLHELCHVMFERTGRGDGTLFYPLVDYGPPISVAFLRRYT
jgi:hypothetical protein